jgi:hypothetical protein
VWAAIIVAVGITIKEAYDYICELDRRQDAFMFDRTDALLNCATSCIYTWIGAVLAVVAVRIPIWSLLAAPALVVLSLPVAAYWLRRKIALQQSDIPFLYRLANFPQNFDGPDGPAIISNLVAHAALRFRHAMLTGPLNSGKTSLAVGTATEFGYRAGLCRYISLVKLAQTGQGAAERPGLHPQTAFQNGRTIWPLDAVELLVVDDADGGIPALEIDPDNVKKARCRVEPLAWSAVAVWQMDTCVLSNRTSYNA